MITGMSERIKLSIAARILERLDELSERPIFLEASRLTRRFYLDVFTPRLERKLRRVTGSALVRLEPRHSVRSAEHFRAFRSDLDYTAVVAESIASAELASLRRAFASARRRWLFLGELEINTEAELSEKALALERHGRLIEPIYWLRKWRYQQRALAQAPTPYHAAKARKSLEVLARNFGLEHSPLPSGPTLGATLERRVAPLVEALRERLRGNVPRAPRKSRFLDWSLGPLSAKESAADTLVLSPEATLVVAGLLPDGADTFNEQGGWIEQLRREPELAPIAFSLHRYELMICESVSRTTECLPEGHSAWVERIRHMAAGKALHSSTTSPKIFEYGYERNA